MALKFFAIAALSCLVQTAMGQCSCSNNNGNQGYQVNNQESFGNIGLSSCGAILRYGGGTIGQNYGGGSNGQSYGGGSIGQSCGSTSIGQIYGSGSISQNYGRGTIGQNYGGSSSSSGGEFPVVFSSPISPSGLSAYSENSIEGVLLVNGNLPFASAVAIDGSLASSGVAGLNYGCGNAVSLNSVGIGVGIGSTGASYGSAGASYGSAGAGYGSIGAGCGSIGAGYGTIGSGIGRACCTNQGGSSYNVPVGYI